MTTSVFISYRRSDQTSLANWLQDKLAGELGVGEVFLDTKSLESGTVFPERLQRAVESARVFIGLIGPEWNAREVNGQRRLDNEEDFVRREIMWALEYSAKDDRRLILPVLPDGVQMPDPAELPECIKAFARFQAYPIPRGDYPVAVRGVVDRAVTHLDDMDTTPDEEKWVVRRIAQRLQSLPQHRIAEIGQAMRRRFQQVTSAPESARALARVAYRLGSPAFGLLLELERSLYQMESLLELLATNWISPLEAAKLRQNFGKATHGKRVAIECKYADFTPNESLLKASHSEDGWARLTVKPGDGPVEIIRQIHDELAQHFCMSVHPRTTAIEEPHNAGDLHRKEKEVILKQLKLRRDEMDGEPLPFVLHVTHGMALHKTLLDIVQAEFPPLHILIATGDADALSKRVGILADIVKPTDDPENEENAFDAYAKAHQIITQRARKSQ
jgi:hypothetical protein